MNYRKLRPSLIALSVIFLCLLPIALGARGRLARQHDWQELGPNSAQEGGISGDYYGGSLRNIIIAPDESVYISWRDNQRFYEGIDRISKWNGRAWESINIPVRADVFFSNLIQIAITQDNKLAALWRWSGRDFTEIVIGLWDGGNWQLIDNWPVIVNNESAATNFHLTTAQVWSGEKWEIIGSNLNQFTTGSLESPSMIATPDGILYLAWSHKTGLEYDYDIYDIYVMQWNGDQWVEISPGSASGGGISQSYEPSENPDLAIASDGSLFVAWREFSIGEDRQGPLRVKHWDGTTWTETSAQLSNDDGVNAAGEPSPPQLAVSSKGVYLTWAYGQRQERQIYVQRWDGLQWHDVGYDANKGGSVSQNRSYSSLPQIAASEEKVCVAWIDDENSALHIRPQLWWNQWEWKPRFSLWEYDRNFSIYARCYFE